MKSKTQIIFEPTDENPFLALYKEKSLPSCALKPDDKNNAVFFATSKFNQLENIKSKSKNDSGLLYRLDTATSGILLFATTQESYDILQKFHQDGQIIKTYLATCSNVEKNANHLEGFPEFNSYRNDLLSKKNVELVSYFRNYEKGSKMVRPVTEESNRAALKKNVKKLYSTKIFISEENEKSIKMKCIISKGYRHQIRCHLAWLGFPIVGDELYNSQYEDGALELECVSISFPHPLTKCPMTICI